MIIIFNKHLDTYECQDQSEAIMEKMKDLHEPGNGEKETSQAQNG